MNALLRKPLPPRGPAERIQSDPRWAAVIARDAAADGAFCYSVRTTGVYCRPSCAARPPRPENVAFHADHAAAERAGFRACRRCRPDRPAEQRTAVAPLRFAVRACPLGALLVAAGERGIAAIAFGDDATRLMRDFQKRCPDATAAAGDDAAFEATLAQVIALIEAPRVASSLPLDVRGTAFQRKVWSALREIPAGTTASYATIAVRIGAPKSVRAVAQACAANTLAVAIPCHRVVRSDGGLSGYRWGVERKRVLLAREAAA